MRLKNSPTLHEVCYTLKGIGVNGKNAVKQEILWKSCWEGNIENKNPGMDAKSGKLPK